MPVAPKSVRIQSSCQCLFTLLGSTGAKAAHRTMMKLTLYGVKLSSQRPDFDFASFKNIEKLLFLPNLDLK